MNIVTCLAIKDVHHRLLQPAPLLLLRYTYTCTFILHLGWSLFILIYTQRVVWCHVIESLKANCQFGPNTQRKSSKYKLVCCVLSSKASYMPTIEFIDSFVISCVLL